MRECVRDAPAESCLCKAYAGAACALLLVLLVKQKRALLKDSIPILVDSRTRDVLSISWSRIHPQPLAATMAKDVARSPALQPNIHESSSYIHACLLFLYLSIYKIANIPPTFTCRACLTTRIASSDMRITIATIRSKRVRSAFGCPTSV